MRKGALFVASSMDIVKSNVVFTTWTAVPQWDTKSSLTHFKMAWRWKIIKRFIIDECTCTMSIAPTTLGRFHKVYVMMRGKFYADALLCSSACEYSLELCNFVHWPLFTPHIT